MPGSGILINKFTRRGKIETPPVTRRERFRRIVLSELPFPDGLIIGFFVEKSIFCFEMGLSEGFSSLFVTVIFSGYKSLCVDKL